MPAILMAGRFTPALALDPCTEQQTLTAAAVACAEPIQPFRQSCCMSCVIASFSSSTAACSVHTLMRFYYVCVGHGCQFNSHIRIGREPHHGFSHFGCSLFLCIMLSPSTEGGGHLHPRWTGYCMPRLQASPRCVPALANGRTSPNI